MITVNVLFFGSLTDVVTKTSDVKIVREGTTVAHLLSLLMADSPTLVAHTFQVAVNQTIVPQTHVLEDGNEVSLLPPFAGG